MVQSSALANQPVEGIQIAHLALRTEIEIGCLDRRQLTRGNIVATHCHVARRIDLQAVACNRRGCKFARKIEHRGSSNVDWRCAIGLSHNGNFQAIIVVPIVDHLRTQTRRITLVARHALQRKDHTIDLGASLPHARSKALATTVSVMGRSIYRQTRRLLANDQTTARDHTTRATDNFAHSDRIINILGK